MNKLITLIFLYFFALNTTALEEAFDTRQQAAGLEDQFDQVVYIDHNLNRVELPKIFSPQRTVLKVTTERFGAKKSETGTLKVIATLKNRTDYDLQIEGRVLFFDQDYFPSEDATAWQRIYLPGNGIGTYRNSSLSFDAAHYIIELREAR